MVRLNHIPREKKFKYQKYKGIKVDELPPRYHKLLKTHGYMKYFFRDERILLSIFRLYDLDEQNKKHRKLWYNYFTDEVTLYKDITRLADNLEWECSICYKPIESNMFDFSIDNFCCEDCKVIYNKDELVDRRIYDSMLSFSKIARKILKRERRKFLSYIRKNSKINNEICK